MRLCADGERLEGRRYRDSSASRRAGAPVRRPTRCRGRDTGETETLRRQNELADIPLVLVEDGRAQSREQYRAVEPRPCVREDAHRRDVRGALELHWGLLDRYTVERDGSRSGRIPRNDPALAEDPEVRVFHGRDTLRVSPIAPCAPDTLASVLVVLWLAAMGAFMLLRKLLILEGSHLRSAVPDLEDWVQLTRPLRRRPRLNQPADLASSRDSGGYCRATRATPRARLLRHRPRSPSGAAPAVASRETRSRLDCHPRRLKPDPLLAGQDLSDVVNADQHPASPKSPRSHDEEVRDPAAGVVAEILNNSDTTSSRLDPESL